MEAVLASRIPSQLDLGRSRRPNQALPWLFAAGMVAATPLAIIFLEPIQVAVAMVSLMVGLFYFSRPAISLLFILGARLVLDLLWMVPGSFGLNMIQLFSGGVFALTAVLFFMNIRESEDNPLFGLFLIFLVLTGVAAARGTGVSGSAELLVRYVSPYFLTFVVAAHMTNPRHWRQAMLIIAIVAAVPIAVSMFHYAEGQHLEHVLDGYSRLLGGYKNLHNHALMMTLFIAVYVFWLSYVRTTILSVVLIAAIGVTTFILYNTYIRTGFLSLAFFGAIFLYIDKRIRLLVGLTLAATLFVALTPAMQDRFKDLVEVFEPTELGQTKGALGSGRWGIWTAALQAYAGMPKWDFILGSGLGGHFLMTQDWVDAHNANKETLDPHNDMLLILFQWGPVGVWVYMAMMWKTVKISWALQLTTPDRFVRLFARFTIALTAAVFVANAVSNSFVHRTSPGWYFWGIVGLACAMWQHEQRRLAAEARRLRAVEAGVVELPTPPQAAPPRAGPGRRLAPAR